MQQDKQSGYITVRVPATMKAELQERAVRERRTLSQVALLLLESALDKKNGKKK